MMVSAAATIIAFYLFISITIVLLVVWIACELVVALVGIRFGMAGYIAAYVERHSKLLIVLSKQLWLRRGDTYRLKLEPAEAPGIVAIMNRLAQRLNIAPPQAIYIEMSAGAWIELRGLQRDFGKSHLGVGYDLLAGLTEEEVEAVLAHELVHAKKVIRFLKRWLNGGFFRAVGVARNLSGIADAHRRAGKPFQIAEWILVVADKMMRWCAKLVTAYSRQDEFEADYGAAELCGSAGLRSALIKLGNQSSRLARLPWNERIAQIQSEEGLSHWLVQELTTTAGKSADDGPHIYDRYSTHPALPDRLAAMPDDGSKLHDSPPGITLLAEPDAVARKLLEEIERIQLKAENKDERALRSMLKKMRRQGRVHPYQLPGLIVGVVVVLMGFWAVGEENGLAVELIFGLGLPVAAYIFLSARYRDLRVLPMVDFAAIKAAAAEKLEIKDIETVQKEIDSKLREKIASTKKVKRKVEILLDEAYPALAKGDYLTAHVVGRLCLSLDRKYAEGSLLLAIASAAFRQKAQADKSLSTVLQLTSFSSASSIWGTAWTLVLEGNWGVAEAFLQELLRKQPNHPTLLALTALCQSNRGKLQNASANIRKTCEPVAASAEHRKLYIKLLLDHGDQQEAARQLQQFGEAQKSDRELLYSRIRLHLLRREFPAAEEQIALLEAQEVPGHYFLGIGGLFERARKDDKAQEFFQRALLRGHYPEGLLGMARLANHAGDKELARRYALSSMDVTKTLGEKATSAQLVFGHSLAMLVNLQDPVANCRAWIARIPAAAKPGPLTNRSLMVYAVEENTVHEYTEAVLRALEPGKDFASSPKTKLNLAPQDLQPVRPVRPGIQYVYI